MTPVIGFLFCHLEAGSEEKAVNTSAETGSDVHIGRDWLIRRDWLRSALSICCIAKMRW